MESYPQIGEPYLLDQKSPMYDPNQILVGPTSVKPPLQKYSTLLVLLGHVAVFFSCVTAKDFPSSSFVHLFMGLLFSSLACCATFLYTKSAVPKFIAAFIAATFTAKLPLCLISPEQTFLGTIPLENKQLSMLLLEKYFLFSLGFFAFAVGAVVASRFFWNMTDPERRDSKMQAVEKGFMLIVVVCLALQSMRAFLLLVLHVGAPSVVTREIFIPRLAGILNILGSQGLLIFVSGLLALALSRRSFFSLAMAAMAAITYIIVEMAGGWRSGLYYYCVCGSWIFFASQPSEIKNRLKPFAIGFAVFAVVLFVPVMDYRHRINQGMSPAQAVRSVMEGGQHDTGGFSVALYKVAKRFNGLDLFAVASHGAEGHTMGVRSLFNGSASQFFKYGILGIPKEAVTTFGITFWGVVSIAIGDRLLWLAGLIFGLFVGGLPLLCRRWFYAPTMRTVYECNLSIAMLSLAMGNGAFFLYSKELLISFLMCLLFRAIITGSPNRQTHYTHPAYAPNSYP